jgi:hypothetical protein
VRTGFWWGDLRRRDHLEDVGLDCRIILKWIFNFEMRHPRCVSNHSVENEYEKQP